MDITTFTALSFVLGVVAHLACQLYRKYGVNTAILSFLVSLSILIGCICFYRFLLFNYRYLPEPLFIIMAGIFISGVFFFYLPRNAFAYINEATLLQLTLLFWYGVIFCVGGNVPGWVLLVGGFFSIFVMIDSFSLAKHSKFMKFFYSVWYLLVSVFFLSLWVDREVLELLLSHTDPSSKITSFFPFFFGIVLVSICSTASSLMILLVLLMIPAPDNGVYRPWHFGYMSEQLSKRKAIFLIILWIGIFSLNSHYSLLLPLELLLISVAAVLEYSILVDNDLNGEEEGID